MARRVTEVTKTVEDGDGAPVNNNPEPSPSTLAERIIWFIGGLLVVLLSLRVLLSLLGANRENGFADLIYGITYPFVAPFFGLFGYSVEYGVSRFEIETVVAILVYLGITAAVAWLVTIGRARRDEA